MIERVEIKYTYDHHEKNNTCIEHTYHDLCPPQTYRRDETRRVSTMKFSSAGVRGPVFASFW